MQAETGITSAHCPHFTFQVSSFEQFSRLISHQYYENEVAKESFLHLPKKKELT